MSGTIEYRDFWYTEDIAGSGMTLAEWFQSMYDRGGWEVVTSCYEETPGKTGWVEKTVSGSSGNRGIGFVFKKMGGGR